MPAKRRPAPRALGLAVALALCGAAQAQSFSMDAVVAAAGQSALDDGSRLAQIGRKRAQAAQSLAAGTFEWQTTGNAFIRSSPEYIASGGFLTSAGHYVTSSGGTVLAERLFENGIRVQPGLLLSRSDPTSTNVLGAVVSLPTITVDVPLDGSLGKPVEKLKLDIASMEAATAQRDVVVARQAHVHRAVRLAWSWLAAQERLQLQERLLADAQAGVERMRRLVARGELPASGLQQSEARRIARAADLQRLRADAENLREELVALLGPRWQREWRNLALRDQLPGAAGSVDTALLLHEALDNRADYLRLKERVETARVKLQIADLQAGSHFNLQMQQRSLVVSWVVPLGEARAAGLKTQAQAEFEAAELEMQDLERRMALDIESAARRLRAAEAALAQLEPAEHEIGRLGDILQRQSEGTAGQTAGQSYTDNLELRTQLALQMVEQKLAIAGAIADLRMYSGQIPVAQAPDAALFRTMQ